MKSIVFTFGKEKLLELGFEKLGKYSYILPIKEHNNYFMFSESKYNDNEYILEISDVSFPDNENAYENLYDFILENKEKTNDFWEYDKILESGFKLNNLSNYFLDSKDGSIVHKNIKSEHSKSLYSLYKNIKNLLNIDDIVNDNRTFYPLSKKEVVEPLILVLDYIELVDLDLKYNNHSLYNL